MFGLFKRKLGKNILGVTYANLEPDIVNVYAIIVFFTDPIATYTDDKSFSKYIGCFESKSDAEKLYRSTVVIYCKDKTYVAAIIKIRALKVGKKYIVPQVPSKITSIPEDSLIQKI